MSNLPVIRRPSQAASVEDLDDAIDLMVEQRSKAVAPAPDVHHQASAPVMPQQQPPQAPQGGFLGLNMAVVAVGISGLAVICLLAGIIISMLINNDTSAAIDTNSKLADAVTALVDEVKAQREEAAEEDEPEEASIMPLIVVASLAALGVYLVLYQTFGPRFGSFLWLVLVLAILYVWKVGL